MPTRMRHGCAAQAAVLGIHRPIITTATAVHGDGAAILVPIGAGARGCGLVRGLADFGSIWRKSRTLEKRPSRLRASSVAEAAPRLRAKRCVRPCAVFLRRWRIQA